MSTADNGGTRQRDPLIVGLSTPQPRPDAATALKNSREDGFDFVTTELPHDLSPRPDVTQLDGRWWRTAVVGVVPEAPSVERLIERMPSQIEWAAHMGIPAVILPAPPSDLSGMMEYARIVQSLAYEKTQTATDVQFWIRTPLTETALANFRTMYQYCDGLSNIGMMLVMDNPQASPSTPPTPTTAAVVAEKIRLVHHAVGLELRALSFPTEIFLTNKSGFPTLAKSHQVLFTEILKRIGRTLRVLLEGHSVHRTSATKDRSGVTGCLTYLQYLQYVRGKDGLRELDSESAQLEKPYLDSLQRPLEPLKDHLEFSMYETFEKDPVKYNKYQEAVFLALSEGLQGAPATTTRQIVIAVAGSGRGPLVTCSIKAFLQLKLPGNITLKVYAVEKNPSAVLYLQSMAQQDDEWKGVVTVVNTDARALTKAMIDNNTIDIVVSELLGSFGDNELSPECLDPLLASDCCRSTTISIPQEYTALLAPVTSMKLHAQVKQQAEYPKSGGHSIGLQRAMETPYVVRTHSASQTHVEQNCWKFEHPATNLNKERIATLEFSPDTTMAAASGCGYGPVDTGIGGIMSQCQLKMAAPMSLHGLLGSFTAVLYKTRQGQSSEISIAPHSFSVGMFSWFPLYFPFRDPLVVPTNANVSVKMWRKTTGGRVWYEWCATVHKNQELIAMTPIHNCNGRSSFVSM